MPFKSAKQERYMWAVHPDIARKWVNEGKGYVDRSISRHGKVDQALDKKGRGAK